MRRTGLRVVTLLLVLSALAVGATGSAEAGSYCIPGEFKGLVWHDGEWHHYVSFLNSFNVSEDRLYVTGPAGPNLWPGTYDNGLFRRAGYSWPSNWPSPWPASSWSMCVNY
jgi:hypothetical protein